MCGIVGIVDFRHQDVSVEAAQHMASQLSHRGPDALGTVALGPVALGHTRLSIVDIAGGAQPMQSRDGQLTITFNGEIYNHIELREQLSACGHSFSTRSDTEVILHAFAEWGDSCTSYFNGQWAFAIFDRAKDRLFLSRDPMGIRPLFFARTKTGATVFASEVKALFAHPDVSRSFDHAALAETLCFWSPLQTHTVFVGVEELPPGHQMVIDVNGTSTREYHFLDYAPADAPLGTEEDAVDQCRALMIESTQLRLRADVPVGAYLSGGLDSTITTAIVSNFSDAPLRTYSVAFESEEHDESAFQQLASKHLGTDHHEIRISEADIANVFPDVVRHAERPLFRTAPAPLFLLSKAVHADGCKVVLTGEGADEVFGGYDIFKEAKIRRFWAQQPNSRLRPQLLRRLYPWMDALQKQSPEYLQKFFHARPHDLDLPHFSHLPRWNLGRRMELFLSDEARAAMAKRDLFQEAIALLPQRFNNWDPLSKAQYLETRMLMPGYFLSAQGDRMAMAHSVEGRFPFLDPRVVAFGAALPAKYKMRGLNEKHILKKAFSDLLPPSVCLRKKQPYRAPDVSSFVSPNTAVGAEPDYIARAFDPGRLAKYGAFHPDKASRLLAKARSKGLTAERDNMAFMTILSTQLLIENLIEDFEPCPMRASSENTNVQYRK